MDSGTGKELDDVEGLLRTGAILSEQSFEPIESSRTRLLATVRDLHSIQPRHRYQVQLCVRAD